VTEKLTRQDRVVYVQPRIRLLRSFDQRSHSYLGYVLQIDGVIGGEARTFTVGIRETGQEKHGFRNGDQVSGVCLPAAEPNREPAELYKVSRLKLLSRGSVPHQPLPPWQGIISDLDEYRYSVVLYH